uniref:NADH-ubiquinone oxidoreductase chain 4 n=1 Tax=Pyronotanthias smithvanizi TaxID=3363808 RepID=A0AAU6QDS7_9TELE
MLMILSMTLMLIPVVWLVPAPWIWTLVISQSTLVAVLSMIWLNTSTSSGWLLMYSYLGLDTLSMPLLVLSTWLLPVMFIASQQHLAPTPATYKRLFVTLLVILQSTLILAFSATELTLFYVMFETTLVPTLFIITRWGNQKERLNAGFYFIFYTLTGSLPFLVALMALTAEHGTLSMVLTFSDIPPHSDSFWLKLWWVACLIAFLVKLPLYGLHLWLPKAHVEAPVAGSMVLAAVLLKLGGYGMMRLMPYLEPLTNQMSYPFMILALWGIVMTAATCLRQTDVKSLIAYSSVGHMGLVAAGILTQTTWGNLGALVMMIAHGLTSSLLFSLANTNYERTHTRTMILVRGMNILLPLMTTWWFFASLANLGFPPLPNAIAELVIAATVFMWAPISFILVGCGAIITVGYSLYLFITMQRGPVPKHIINMAPTHTREHLLMVLHAIPLMLLVLKPELISGNMS